VGHGDLLEARLARERRHALLVRRKAVTVHEHDGDRAIALLARGREVGPRLRLVERAHDFAVRAHALVDLVHLAIEHLRQLDVPVEDARPVLVGDAQLVAEALRDEEHGGLALALEERVGGDRRAHLHGIDLLDGDRSARRHAEQMANAGHGGIAILFRILREQLVGGERAIRPARDDVGERAAAIDPEFPAATHCR
jgi:hypothetical protein